MSTENTQPTTMCVHQGYTTRGPDPAHVRVISGPRSNLQNTETSPEWGRFYEWI